MDDDAADAVDLSALLVTASPADGPSRARQAGDRIRVRSRVMRGVGIVAVIALIGVPTINAVRDDRADQVFAGGGRDRPDPRPEPDPRLADGRPRLFALGAVYTTPTGVSGSGIGRKQLGLWIDTETGEQTPVELPPGTTDMSEAAVGAMSRSGGIVLSAWSSEKSAVPIWFLASDSTKPVRIATGLTGPIASAAPDRIWLIQKSFGANGGVYAHATEVAVEIDMSGRTRRRLTFPCCRTLVADSALGPLASKGTNLELWDAASMKVTRSIADVPEDITASGTTVRYAKTCPDRGDLGSVFVLGLETGATRQLGPDCAYSTGLSGQLLSPTGLAAAAWLPIDGAASSLVLFDLARPTPIQVPRSTTSDYPLAWGPVGVYFSDDGFGEGPSPRYSIQAFNFGSRRTRTIVTGFWAKELAFPLPGPEGD